MRELKELLLHCSRPMLPPTLPTLLLTQPPVLASYFILFKILLPVEVCENRPAGTPHKYPPSHPTLLLWLRHHVELIQSFSMSGQAWGIAVGKAEPQALLPLFCELNNLSRPCLGWKHPHPSPGGAHILCCQPPIFQKFENTQQVITLPGCE